MDIGIGLDWSLGLSFDDQAQLARVIASLGYSDLWTPDHSRDDPFQVCLWRWAATVDVVPGGLRTGIGVSPLGPRTPLNFAQAGGTLSKLSGGKFILGLGTGSANLSNYRAAFGIQESSMLRLTQDYVSTIRALQTGELIETESRSFSFRRGQLSIDPPTQTPIYLGVLGPEMLRLAGAIADGVILNWCSAAHNAWSRDRIAEGAERVGRDPSEVKVSGFVRVCVDDDPAVARRMYVNTLLDYGRQRGYAAHFKRMGYADLLTDIEAMRRAKTPKDTIADSVPEDFALAVGYYGCPDGANAALADLAQGLDTAIVRVVAPPGVKATRAVIESCRPIPAHAR